MSGKKSQRTKGNVKPSSSSRAAEFLNQEGTPGGFIGFSALAGNSLGYVPQVKNEEEELDGDLRMLLRKMTKKATVTKLKAIQEFTELCKTKEDDVISSILSFWPRIYHKLAHDYDHRVREATQQAHHQIVTKAGRNLAPHLKLIITDWLISHFDTYAPASTAAKIAFNHVFQGDKRKEVLAFCKAEILETLQNHVLKETMDTLSDPKVVPVEEREAKFFRFISSSFHALSYFLRTVAPSQLKNSAVTSSLDTLLHDKKLWKYVKNTSPLIRNAFFTFLGSCLQTISDVLSAVLPQLCTACLTHLDEQEPTVVASMWDAALLCLSTFETSWDHVNSRKAVLPNLWKVLKNGGYGNVTVVYPNLLPLIMHIPVKVTGEGSGFYNEFFGNFLEGLHSKQNVLTSSDTQITIRSFVECFRFLLMKRSGDMELVAYLINSLLPTILKEIFLSEEPRQMWYGMLFIELKSLLNAISEQASRQCESEDKDSSQPEQQAQIYYQTIEKDVWGVLTSTIVQTRENSDGQPSFQRDHRNFYDSLVDFIYCLCDSVSERPKTQGTKEPVLQDLTPSTAGVIPDMFNGFLINLLKDCIASYVSVISSSLPEVKRDFVNILSVSLCEPLLVYAIQLLSSEGVTVKIDDSSQSLLVAQTFVQVVISPLVEDSCYGDNAFVKAVASVLKLLAGTDKESYLRFVLEEFTKTETMKINMLSEIFKYKEDEIVGNWLKSQLVQDIITRLCSSNEIKSTSPLSTLRWDILNAYAHLIQDNPDRLAAYCARLLSLMTEFFKQHDPVEDKSQLNSLLNCFSTVSSKELSYSPIFVEVWLSVFRKIVSKEGDDCYRRSAAVGLQKISQFTNEEFQAFSGLFVAAIQKWLHTVDLQTTANEVCELVQNLRAPNGQPRKMDVIIVDQLFKVRQYQNVEIHQDFLLRFQGELLAKMSEKCPSSLQEANQEQLLSWFQDVLMVKNENVKKCLELFVRKSEYLHTPLLQSSVKRSTVTKNTDIFEWTLSLLSEQDLLSDELMDHCLQLVTPSDYVDLQSTDALTVVVPYICDVSCVRAFVVKYADELQNDGDVKSNTTAFTCNLTILSAVLRKWHEMLTMHDENEATSNDYVTTMTETLDMLLVWKEEHGDAHLFPSNLNETDPIVIALNAQLMEILVVAMTTCVNGLRKEHWDFILCSLVSWLQSCQESYVYQIANTRFFINALKLFYIAASIFKGNDQESIFNSPGVALALDVPTLRTPVSSEMNTEWVEFFLPGASASTISMFNAVVDTNKFDRTDEFSHALCACCNFLQTAVVTEECINNNSGNKKKGGGKKRSPSEEFFIKMCHIMKEGSWCFKIASFQLLSKIGDVIEEFCVDHEEDEEHEELRSFPEPIIEVMEESRNLTLKCLADKGASIIEPTQDLGDGRDKTSLLTYLLSWHFMLQIFQLCSLDKRAKLANYLHKTSHVHDLVTCLFCIIPINCEKEAKRKFDQVTTFSYVKVQYVAVNLLTKAMQYIPALLRHWFNNHLNRNEVAQIDRFVSANVSPELLKNEFQRLDGAFKTFDNMVVKTRPTAREVVAVYTIEEISMELVVKLAANYPLSPVTVECGKRIGVATSLWRQWMLQLTTFLSFQNGTILDGLTLWKKNVDKRFEGVEECMVCFSVIHGSNYSLPTISCKTCKKKFHPACLYKWFNTSGKSTCPLCRNIF